MAKAEQLSLEVQCVSGLADEVKKLCERRLALDSALRAKVLERIQIVGNKLEAENG